MQFRIELVEALCMHKWRNQLGGVNEVRFNRQRRRPRLARAAQDLLIKFFKLLGDLQLILIRFINLWKKVAQAEHDVELSFLLLDALDQVEELGDGAVDAADDNDLYLLFWVLYFHLFNLLLTKLYLYLI